MKSCSPQFRLCGSFRWRQGNICKRSRVNPVVSQSLRAPFCCNHTSLLSTRKLFPNRHAACFNMKRGFEKSFGGFTEMTRIQKLALTIFSAALLTGATVALPSHAATQAMPSQSSPSAQSPSAQSPSAGASEQGELQSVSGKITSVSGKTFTLSASASPSSPTSPTGSQFQSSASSAEGQSMTFTINDNTTVSGKLAVGASADVTYRTQGGQNIAVSVRVSS